MLQIYLFDNITKKLKILQQNFFLNIKNKIKILKKKKKKKKKNNLKKKKKKKKKVTNRNTNIYRNEENIITVAMYGV